MAVTPAFAGSYGGSYGGGSGGSYGGSSGGSYGASSGGTTGRGGLFRGMFRRARGSHSSGGSYGASSGGSYGASSGGSYGASSGGSYGGSSGGVVHGGSSGGASSGGSYGAMGYAGGAYSSYAGRSTVDPNWGSSSVPNMGNITRSEQADALLTIYVPAQAKVYVNGRLTSTPGEERTYVSRNVSTDSPVQYSVRIVADVDGQEVELERQVSLFGGRKATLDFEQLHASEQNPSTTTTLTVMVPENAKVYLEGTITKTTGAERVFRTTKLQPGESWDNYTVRAEIEQDGRTVTKEQTIVLAAGDRKELAFDFEPELVASAR